MNTDIWLTLSTCPDEKSALKIAEALITEGDAACVNLIPAVTSVYRWQGKIERAQEVLLIIKSPAQRFTQLRERLRALHPYELPEIVAVPVQGGLAEYLDWVRACTSGND